MVFCQVAGMPSIRCTDKKYTLHGIKRSIQTHTNARASQVKLYCELFSTASYGPAGPSRQTLFLSVLLSLLALTALLYTPFVLKEIDTIFNLFWEYLKGPTEPEISGNIESINDTNPSIM